MAIGGPFPTHDGGAENTWPSFDVAGHEQYWQAGYVDAICIETALGMAHPKFIPQDVIEGRIDSYLTTEAEDIRDWGRPIFWMYPREPLIQPAWGYDGGGYGPDGTLTREEASHQGYSELSQYGDEGKLDGPERYVDMCRHIFDVVSPIAGNATWVMGGIAARFSGAYTQWYPGNSYVDWHALDVYVGSGLST